MIFNKGGWKVESKWGECKDHIPKWQNIFTTLFVLFKRLSVRIDNKSVY